MDGFSSGTTASRRPWSEKLSNEKSTRQHNRNEAAVTLPVLARRRGGQITTTSRNNSLHTALALELEENDRESYSRSQLRAMASSKLLSGNNYNVRIYSSAERLAPLDPASYEKARTQQHRPLPGPLQAAINIVLAERSEDEPVSERGESRGDSINNSDEPETTVPKVKQTSPCKTQIQRRRPEWSRYIRRIMMTKGIQGSTLARYRRLVGIVARKNLNQSFAGAVERVVQYRLEFRSAVAIQIMILRFLTRRRQAKQLETHRAAVRIQHIWRRLVEIEKQRKLAEAVRLAKVDRLIRSGAIRSIQRSYRKYRHICYMRAEERRQQEQESLLQKARLKLLRRYQSWRESSKRDKVVGNLELIDVGDVLSTNLGDDEAGKERSCRPEETDSCSVDVTTNCGLIVRDGPVTKTSDVAPHQLDDHDIRIVTEQTSVLIGEMLRKSDERSNNQVLTSLKEVLIVQHQDESPVEYVNVAIAMCTDENQSFNQDEFTVDLSPQQRLLPYQHTDKSTSEVVCVSEAKTEPEDDNESDEDNQGVDEVHAGVSYPRDPERSFDPQTDKETVKELSDQATVAATETARTAAADRIARFVLLKFQVRRKQKVHAVIQIQCIVRVYLAKLCMVRVRLAALHSFREQLLASWHPVDKNENLSEQDPVIHQNDDEDDEFDLELQGYQPAIHELSDNYIHMLPTRNGQIPPGVPLLQSSAGTPLLSLWKWSWPGERWISNNQ